MKDSAAESQGVPLRFALPLTWGAGIISAFGAELIGLSFGLFASGARTSGAVHLAIAFGIWTITNALALALLYFGLFRLSPLPQYSVGASVRTLLLGSAGVIALSNAITPGGARPPFGSLTMLLLTVPYPLAYLVVEARRRTPMAVTAAVALALAAAAVPLRQAQEHSVVQNWLSSHPSSARALLSTVDWPGASPEPNVTTGPFGVRTVVRYVGDASDKGGVITVSPATADPCAAVGELASGDGLTSRGEAVGSLVAVKPEHCVSTSATTWTISDGAWSGYAVQSDGLLVTLSFSSPSHHPNLAAVARTLHPMNDADLWPYLQADSGVPVLLL